MSDKNRRINVIKTHQGDLLPRVFWSHFQEYEPMIRYTTVYCQFTKKNISYEKIVLQNILLLFNCNSSYHSYPQLRFIGHLRIMLKQF